MVMSEVTYLLNEAQALLVTMHDDSETAKRVRGEMIAIIKAWHRGRLLPRAQTPMLNKLYDKTFDRDDRFPEGA
jgi:hypothetical protein